MSVMTGDRMARPAVAPAPPQQARPRRGRAMGSPAARGAPAPWRRSSARRVPGTAAGTGESRRLRLTRRGRVAVAGLAAGAALLGTAPLWLATAVSAQVVGSGTPASAVYGNLTRVVVRPGQTLWSIASRAEPTADPRIVVEQIMELNALNGPLIQPGELLWVPRG